ncbi:Uncharacterised protein [Stenotrophomonas maltophilia]|nr:Uncharacterised protein [Stenotrophomonas maltophilia]
MPQKKEDSGALKIDFYVTPEEYEDIAIKQKEHVRAIADKVLIDGPLDLSPSDRRCIAAILRFWADELSTKRKGKQGHPPRFCHGSAALEYAMERWEGHRHGEALERMAERYEVSTVSINNAIKPYRAAAFAMIGETDPGNQ